MNIACTEKTFNVAESNRNKLAAYVTCKLNTTPENFVNTIEMAGGKSLISGNHGTVINSMYSLTTPVSVYGYPVTKFSLHLKIDNDGDFNEYAAVIEPTDNQTTPEVIAQLAQVPKINEDYFIAHIDGDDLIIRKSGDIIYLSCANDVRTITKSIKHTLQEMTEK